MNIAATLFLVLVNAASEKEFTDLSHTAAFLLRNLRQDGLDPARHPEADLLVLRCHHWGKF